MEIYYERLSKLANSFQHKTIDSFLTIVFRFGLCTTIFMCSNNKHEERNHVVT
jgi:hypothetical protein